VHYYIILLGPIFYSSMEEAWLLILIPGTARGGAHASTVAGVRKEEARGVIRISHLSVCCMCGGEAQHTLCYSHF